jgi:energy-coupling factor transport system ATP-binding protein
MFAAMPTPVRVFYGADGVGECPLTVREGRTWLSKSYPAPKVNALPAEKLEDEIEKPALSLKELWFRYEKDSPDVLRGVSAEVPTGTLYAIVGGNGAGKSTTLKAICGICKPYRGKVKVFGKPVEKYKSAELFGGCLAMLPQDPKSLFVKKTVREDLAEMTKDKKRIAEIAEVCEIESLLSSHPYDLSGGEQQRSALAKVLLTNPKLLLLDEPTKGIDSFFKEKLAKILCKLKEQGITIVMVSHDVEFCAKYADVVSMFFDGQMLTTDTPRRFFGNNSFYTTAANRMSRHVFSMAVTAEDVVELCRQNVEAEV